MVCYCFQFTRIPMQTSSAGALVRGTGRRAAGQGEGCRARAAGRGLRAELQGEGSGQSCRAQGAKKHTNSLSWCVDVSVADNHSRKTRHQHCLRLSRCCQHHHERRCIMSATVRRTINTHRRQPNATMAQTILQNSLTNQLLAIV